MKIYTFSAEDPDEIVETPSTTEEAEDEDDLEEGGEDSEEGSGGKN